MSNIGHFLEFAVRTGNILESLNFYKTLGFVELEIGDMWPHKYAVVSDGDLAIGLHDRDFDAPAVTFVKPDLAKSARQMSDHGYNFTFMQLGDESFNELRFRDRDKHTIIMLEARTFHASDAAEKNTLLGSFIELTLPVRDTLRAAQFWAPIAPTLLDMREEPPTHMRFDASGIALGLSESIALKSPSLSFNCSDRPGLMAKLEQHGINYAKFPGFEGAFVEIRAPEGTLLYAFEKDFLGESYEVEESGLFKELTL